MRKKIYDFLFSQSFDLKIRVKLIDFVRSNTFKSHELTFWKQIVSKMCINKATYQFKG